MASNGDPPIGQNGDPPKQKNGDPSRSGNIESRDDGTLWDPNDVRESLHRLFAYVVGEAHRTERWYWKAKGPKALGARVIQILALALTGLAGLIPIATNMVPRLGEWVTEQLGAVDTGLMTTFCLGLGAALVASDRAASLSSGWTRYVLTATAIRGATEEFRMDWAALMSNLGEPPKAEQVTALLQRAKAFRMTIEALVTKETQEWATEFKNALAQLEKDIQARFDTAKAERQKADDERRARADREADDQKKAAAPGAVEATITNAGEADGFKFEARLGTNDAELAKEDVSNSDSWARLAVPAGDYKLTVTASIKTKKVAKSAVISVKPGETTKVSLTLPPPP